MSETMESLIPAVRSATTDLMSVDDVTEGVAPGNSIRLRGRLLVPSDEAYGQVRDRLQPYGVTPLLRKDEQGRDVLFVLPATFGAAIQRRGLALILFVLTALSSLFVGAQMTAEVAQTGEINWNLLAGLPFAASLLAILAAHEFGHYLVARRLGTPVSLPYFIPMPFGPFGTLGAFISMSAPPRNRRHLLAIGAAGPLAGLVLALPILWIGLSLSEVTPLPPTAYSMEGNSLLYAAMKFLQFGRFLPSGGEDVWIHPVAFAGWAGLLVTGLNLIPAGQLDGGHIVYALLGEKGARLMLWIVLAALAGLSFLWTGWLLWVLLIFAFSRTRTAPLDDVTGLTGRQRVLAVVMVIVFVLIFTPIPLTLVQP